MAKYPIEKGVPKNVTVGEAKCVEIHQKLGGSQAMPGTAKSAGHLTPSKKREGSDAAGQGG